MRAAVLHEPHQPLTIETVDIAIVRQAIREGQALQIGYEDDKGAISERRIWPFGLAYFETVRVVLAWCELRSAFRHFRTDRIRSLSTDGRYPGRRADLVRRWEETELAGVRSRMAGTAPDIT